VIEVLKRVDPLAHRGRANSPRRLLIIAAFDSLARCLGEGANHLCGDKLMAS
jgi:hypothetical protein